MASKSSLDESLNEGMPLEYGGLSLERNFDIYVPESVSARFKYIQGEKRRVDLPLYQGGLAELVGPSLMDSGRSPGRL